MTAARTALRVADVKKRFDGVNAIDGVSLELEAGSWLGLIGPNGSGKTTLLNVLTGIYAQSEGAIYLGACDISRFSAARRAKMGIARTFQHPQLALSLATADNIEAGATLGRRSRTGKARFAGLSRSELGAKTRAAATLFNCHAHLDTLPEYLPYGALKAIELARAVAAEPEFLFLDEPAAGLSREERDELRDSLARLRRERPQLAVCLVEHDVSLVAAMCDELAVLAAGKLIVQGPPAAVLADPRVVEAYLGDADTTTTLDVNDA